MANRCFATKAIIPTFDFENERPPVRQMSGLDLVAEVDGDHVILRPIDVALPLAGGAERVAMATGALHDEQVFGAESKRPRRRVKVAGIVILTETLEGQIQRLTGQRAKVDGAGMEDGGGGADRGSGAGGGRGRGRGPTGGAPAPSQLTGFEAVGVGSGNVERVRGTVESKRGVTLQMTQFNH